MRIRILSYLLIFGPSDPDPLLFLLDPDPTCNNRFINYFHLEQNINQNHFKLKIMVYKIEFYAYLPKIFLHFELRSDPDPSKKMLDPRPC